MATNHGFVGVQNLAYYQKFCQHLFTTITMAIIHRFVGRQNLASQPWLLKV